MMQQVSGAPPPTPTQAHCDVSSHSCSSPVFLSSVSQRPTMSSAASSSSSSSPPLLLIALLIAATNCSLPLVSFLRRLSKQSPHGMPMLSPLLLAVHLHTLCLFYALSLLSRAFASFFLLRSSFVHPKIFSRHLRPPACLPHLHTSPPPHLHQQFRMADSPNIICASEF